MKKIIYEENGITKIITPTKEALNIFSIEQIAENELPKGTEYKILDEYEANKLLAPNIDEKAKQLAEIEADIKECEDDIKHALIIGNTAVLENLRNEYKSLLAEREKLQEQE